MSENSGNNNLLSFIATTVEELRDKFKQMQDKMETLATKDELKAIRDRIVTKDEFKAQIAAVRGDIEQVHLRLDSIEKTLTGRLSQIEAEVSKLRSVVYMLVKDKPELLRLLG